ncbi:MAG: hypothetical protein IT287_03035 [Bdellovibrionaceae bacterium]|nr:hypothetical protein [Pseudobdellovibrionaceae bacterium]
MSSAESQELPQTLISAVASHITQALENKYAEAVFYPDMGHVHILAPAQNYETLKSGLNRKDLLFLYHTAELIQMKSNTKAGGSLVENPWLQWRYYSRNFIGTLDPLQKVTVVYSNDSYYNTVRFIPGYNEIETLYLSAHHEGCFSYKSRMQTLNFDISLNQ